MKLNNVAVVYFTFEKLSLTQLPNVVYVETDPTTVNVTVTKPDGTVSIVAATKVTGTVSTYYIEYTCTIAGVWRAKAITTGTVVVETEEVRWTVS